jgi:hypothetical protein
MERDMLFNAPLARSKNLDGAAVNLRHFPGTAIDSEIRP